MLQKLTPAFTIQLLSVLALLLSAGSVHAQGPSFTYQGRLTEAGAPAHGTYDLQFKLYDAANGGNQLGAAIEKAGMTVTNGLFTVQLNESGQFGVNAFPGADRYLEISVRHDSSESYTTLSPRQPITSTPYAIRSASAVLADTATNAQQLGGAAASQYVLTSDLRLSDARPPTAGSTNYIQNTTTQQSANFHISGSGTLGGNVTASSVSVTGGSGLTLGTASQNEDPISISRVDRAINQSDLVLTIGDDGGSGASGNDRLVVRTTNMLQDLLVLDVGLPKLTINGELNVTSTLSGNGSGLTNLNASNISSGTLSNARLGVIPMANGGTGSATQNFVDLSTNQIIGGTKTFSSSIAADITGHAATAGNVTGIVSTAHGGTGLSSAGATGNFLRSNSGTWASAPLQASDIVGGSTNYIQNTSTPQASSNFNISGTGTASIFDAATQYNINAKRVLSVAGSENLFAGDGAGIGNTTGRRNSFFGREAGFSNTMGGSNTFFGYLAGNENTTGSNNTLLGARADVGANNLTNATAIGADAIVNTSNTMVLGTSSVTVQVPGTLSGNGSGLTNLNGGNLTAASVTAAKLANASVTAAKLADDSVTEAKLADASITAAKLAPGVMNPQQVALLRWYAANLTANFAVGSGPYGVAFDGANVWVANAGSSSVTKLRASDGTNLGSFAVGGSPRGVAFDGAHVWLANYFSDSVTKLRASDGTNLGSWAVGDGPYAVAFDGANVWVTNSGSDTVTKLRASDGTSLGSFAVGDNPLGIAFDGANIWVTNFNSHNVTKLRASDGTNLGSFAVTGPYGVAFDGANVWVANAGSSSVTKLRASDGTNLGSFAVGGSPIGVAFDGANIWVANTASNNMTKLPASDGPSIGSFAVGDNPFGVAFDGANVWVTNSGSDTVSKR